MVDVYNLKLDLNWSLIAVLSKIDRFDASWTTLEKKEGQSLRQLKSIATVRSVGASTRIEGSKMNNEEVDRFLNSVSIDKLEDRDSQEVKGYFDVMNEISDAYDQIRISENEIKGLHNLLLKYSQKDDWHKGNYKQHSNSVEATAADGSTQIVFQTTPPGYETEDAMRSLVKWYIDDQETHPLIKCAIFSYEFVSIHPFQDGNGRMSRLIANLLLLKNGYKWIQYVSFEHEIESKKLEYYRVLRMCQAERPNEDVSPWVIFFMNSLVNIQDQLMKKLDQSGSESSLTPKERSILTLISSYPGIKSGTISEKLKIPKPTTKKILKKLVDSNLLEKHGIGRSTNYSIK